MANYDNKLGEWFKQVEQQEQALKAKKTGGDAEITEQPTLIDVETPLAPQIRKMEIEGPAREASASTVATVETSQVVADTALAVSSVEDSDLHVDRTESAAKLFGEDDAAPVEDFFTFLNRSAEPPVVEEVEEHVFELPKESSTLGLSEGTGEPRPLVQAPPPVAPVEAPPVQARVEIPLPPKPKPVSAPKPRVETQPRVAADAEAQANWDRVPRHLQMLFGASDQEVAQNSYKAFKETRGELIQRLLDPTVSLEEAARVLNVCPTTVRRYTNRGVLQHYRTAGNQRRFKLSEVLAFMEKGQRRGPSTEETPVDSE